MAAMTCRELDECMKEHGPLVPAASFLPLLREMLAEHCGVDMPEPPVDPLSDDAAEWMTEARKALEE